MPSTPPTVRRRILGRELRRLREAAGLTLRELGTRIERTEASLSRVENGLNAIRALDVKNMLDALGTKDEHVRERLFALARDARKRGWWQSYSDLLAPEYADLISLEGDASLIRTFEMVTVPGLLQTEGYARAMAEALPPHSTPEEVDAFVRIRLARQEILTRADDPLRLNVVLSEAVLHQQVGGAEVMKAQLSKLLETSHLPNVTIRVLPYSAGAHPGFGGPFVVLRFREPAPLKVVLLENMTSSLYLEDDAQVGEYVRTFEQLEELALEPATTRTAIARMSDNL